MLGIAERMPCGDAVGVHFPHAGMPTADLTPVETEFLKVVGAMPGTEDLAAAERDRVQAVISAVRARAVAGNSTYAGSGSEGPEARGRRDACDEIWRLAWPHHGS